MDSSSINLPTVIQQVGDVSRVADLAQRQGQAQQSAAQEQAARQHELERSSVPRAERTDADNRVNVGDHGGGGQPHSQGREKQPAAEKAPSPLLLEGSGLVDVVV